MTYLKVAMAVSLVLAGWLARGVVAERDALQVQVDADAVAADQRALAAKVEAADVATRKESSTRLDTQDQARQTEIQYVDREVVRFVVKYKDVACPDGDDAYLAEWVCLYDRANGLPCELPQVGAAGR